MIAVKQQSKFQQIFSNSYRYVYWLITFWICGLFAGCVISIAYPLTFTMCSQQYSFIILIISISLPLLLTYLSFLLGKPYIIFCISFLKAFVFSYAGSQIACFFQSASWLFCFLFLFSDSCFSFVLFILWLRHFTSHKIYSNSVFYFCAFLGIATVAIDHFVVSPFLNGLF